MQEIRIKIDPKGRISSSRSLLGREGENKPIQLLIDTSLWITDYPEAPLYSMNVERGSNEWTVFAGRAADDSGIVRYIVEDILLEKQGELRIQVEASSGDIRIRTDQLSLRVGDSIFPSTPPSSNFPEWYQEMLDAANTLGGQTVEAKLLLDNAESALSDVSEAIQSSEENISIIEQLVLDTIGIKEDAAGFAQDAESHAEDAGKEADDAGKSATEARHWAEKAKAFFGAVSFNVEESGNLFVTLPDDD